MSALTVIQLDQWLLISKCSRHNPLRRICQNKLLVCSQCFSMLEYWGLRGGMLRSRNGCNHTIYLVVNCLGHKEKRWQMIPTFSLPRLINHTYILYIFSYSYTAAHEQILMHKCMWVYLKCRCFDYFMYSLDTKWCYFSWVGSQWGSAHSQWTVCDSTFGSLGRAVFRKGCRWKCHNRIFLPCCREALCQDSWNVC